MTETISTSAPPTPSTAKLGYQPALDGVRGVAIALVVLFHYNWGYRNNAHFNSNRVHGGFLGVDVFFVLSGFLITTLLLQEHTRFGRIGLRSFYARRALRLFPALAVFLLIGLVLHFTLANSDVNRPQTSGLLGVLFYVANWVRNASPNALGIVGHSWSLAIEEQFYIVWPIFLIVLLRRELRTGTIAAITAAAVAASAAWSAWYWHDHLLGPSTNPILAFGHAYENGVLWNRIYFGTDTRADTLLTGCLTAILIYMFLPRIGPRARAWLSAASVCAFGVGALIVVHADAILSSWLPEWGFLAFSASIAVLIAGLVAAPRAPLTRAFAFGPLVWLGRRSYAIYLFHLFVYYWCRRSKIPLQPQISFVFQMAVILAVAELSYRLVEAPMLRRKQRFEPG